MFCSAQVPLCCPLPSRVWGLGALHPTCARCGDGSRPPGAAKLLWTVPRVVLLAAGRSVVGAVSAFQTSFVPAKKLQTGFGSWNVAFSDVQWILKVFTDDGISLFIFYKYFWFSCSWPSRSTKQKLPKWSSLITSVLRNWTGRTAFLVNICVIVLW